MRCDGDRCGPVRQGRRGDACLIYAVSPDVCRTMPGDVDDGAKAAQLPVLA
jgi:hypothetical protein